MRVVFFLLVLLSCVFAQKITLGAGPYFQTQPYKGVDTLLIPSPVVFYDNGILYVRWTRIGAYFLGKKSDNFSWGLSVTAQPRPYGYEASDSQALTGMQKRKNTWEGGLALSVQADTTYFEVMALNDLLNATDAWILKAELGDEFSIAELTFYPSVLAIYQSSQYTNYYYGVRESESTLTRRAYKPESGVTFAVQTYISYPLTKKLSVLINLRADLLSNQVSNSPIVEDNFIYSGLLSLIYTLEY